MEYYGNNNHTKILKYIEHNFPEFNLNQINNDSTRYNKILETYKLINSHSDIDDILYQMRAENKNFIPYNAPANIYNRKLIIYKNTEDQIDANIEKLRCQLIIDRKQPIAKFDIGFYLQDNDIMFRFLSEEAILNENYVSSEIYNYLKYFLLNNIAHYLNETENSAILKSALVTNSIRKRLEDIYQIKSNPCFLLDYSQLISAKIAQTHYNDHIIELIKYSCSYRNLEILTGINKRPPPVLNEENQIDENMSSVVLIYPNETNVILYNTNITDLKINNKTISVGKSSFNYTVLNFQQPEEQLLEASVPNKHDDVTFYFISIIGLSIISYIGYCLTTSPLFKYADNVETSTQITENSHLLSGLSSTLTLYVQSQTEV